MAKKKRAETTALESATIVPVVIGNRTVPTVFYDGEPLTEGCQFEFSASGSKYSATVASCVETTNGFIIYTENGLTPVSK